MNERGAEKNYSAENTFKKRGSQFLQNTLRHVQYLLFRNQHRQCFSEIVNDQESYAMLLIRKLNVIEIMKIISTYGNLRSNVDGIPICEVISCT